jgi:hypothetical protein
VYILDPQEQAVFIDAKGMIRDKFFESAPQSPFMMTPDHGALSFAPPSCRKRDLGRIYLTHP